MTVLLTSQLGCFCPKINILIVMFTTFLERWPVLNLRPPEFKAAAERLVVDRLPPCSSTFLRMLTELEKPFTSH